MIRAFEQLFVLLGRQPEIDPQAPAELAAIEAKLRRPLPGALREWYSFNGACRAECWPGPLADLVEWTEAIDQNALGERLYLGGHDGDVNYYVLWSDGDDPMVRLQDMTFGLIPIQNPEAGRFSWNVWSWTLRRLRWDYWARTFSFPFGPAAWEFMSARFQMDRLPSEVSADVVFFERDVSIEVRWEMGDPTQQHCSADLVLRSRTQDSFVRAGRTLGPLLDWFADIDSARDASASARDILVKGLR